MVDAPPPTTEFQEGQVEADGFRINYREASHAQGGAPVVLLEGVSWFSGQLQAALAQQYHVVGLQLPGFGASPVNTTSRTVKDLADTTARAAAQVAGEGYTLVGSSFAANVALWQALRWPDRVEALVLISPRAILPQGGPLTGAPEQTARLLAHPDQALPVVDREVLAKELDLAQRLEGSGHDAEGEYRLGEVQCPTLVVFGLKDRTVADGAASVYRERVPNCNVSIVYDAGHLILADRPQALISVVADYVERRETFIVGRQSSVINP